MGCCLRKCTRFGGHNLNLDFACLGKSHGFIPNHGTSHEREATGLRPRDDHALFESARSVTGRLAVLCVVTRTSLTGFCSL